MTPEARIARLEAKVDALQDLIHQKHEDTIREITALWKNGPITRIEARLTLLENTIESGEVRLDEHVLNCPAKLELESYARFRKRWWPPVLVALGVTIGALVVSGVAHPDLVKDLIRLLPW